MGLVILNAFLGSLAIVAATVAAVERRRATARIVVGELALATAQQVPLGTALTLAGKAERGRAGLYLRRIAQLISQGLPLSEAVRQGYPGCPALVMSVVQAGERAGRPAIVLRMIEEQMIDESRRRQRVVPMVAPYGLFLLTFLILATAGVMVVIIPKFKEIFRDFNANLPDVTILLIDIGTFIASFGWLWVCGLLVVVPLIIYWTFRPRRPDRPRVASRIADRIRWALPGFHGVQESQGMATVAGLMRLFIASGMSFDRAADLASQTDVNVVLRRKLARFAELLAIGSTPMAAAREARLDPMFTMAMRAGWPGGRLETALRYVADYHTARMSRLFILARNLVWPVATMCLGALVLLFVSAMFIPLVSLINAVCAFGPW